jgi:hypothetical protein
LKPGPARRVNPGLEPGRVEEKIGEEKTRRDPADLATWLTRQDPVKNSVLKRFRFIFFKKKIDLGDPVTRLKPGTRALNRVGH